MADELPVQNSGKWTFNLQQAQNLQFRIAPEQGTSDQVIIEGHDISALLDFLYDNRELIYEATHDEALRHMEALHHSGGGNVEARRIERFFYIDDGMQRIQGGL
jgi:hypothetical protein